MRIVIRNFLSKILDKDRKKRIKKLEYKIKKKLIKNLPLIEKEEIIDILINKFKIKSGDNLFIHASLDMLNTSLTPLQILEILLDIVGNKGSISAPTFIRYGSKEWMEMDKVFDMKRTASGMGVFSERVRRHKLSKRSIHPTKSIASIGLISTEITSEHEISTYPFGENSPFFKLMKNHNVKVLGIGAPMSYLSMVHVIEDSCHEAYPIKVNEPKIYSKDCIVDKEHIVNVKTYVHNLKIVGKANPEKFIKKFMNKNNYQIYNYYLTPFFIVDGQSLLNELEIQMKKGNTIYD